MWRDTVPPHLSNRKAEMRKFLVKISAYSYFAKFEVLAEDNAISLEQSILDKLGEKSINWEYLGNSYDDRVNRITYEEVIDANAHQRPIQNEEGSRDRVGGTATG